MIDPARRDLQRIFAAAVRAVEPSRLVRAHLKLRQGFYVLLGSAGEVARWQGRTLVVGAGKAAARMAAGCEAALGPANVYGLVVVPDGCAVPLQSIRIAPGSHPSPDARNERATRRLCGLIRGAGPGPILCLISGGASSLLAYPRPPLNLKAEQQMNELLLASGADIRSINAVRKHLSLVKGGGLLRLAAPRPVFTLMLSDVIGDDPSVIGSGPTTPDPTTFDMAAAAIARAGIGDRIPRSVRRLIDRGMRGAIAETLKPDDPQAAGALNVVVGSNETALAAAAREARRLGYVPVVLQVPLAGDTTRCARAWAALVLAEVQRRAPKRCCVIAGGETTVRVRGTGRGGRNQEFALAAAMVLKSVPIAILSAGTDGIDGPTDAAGAFADGTTIRRGAGLGLNAGAWLRNNDSYTYFDTLGDLIRCGPTGTNVMDIKLAVGPTSALGTPVVQA